MREIKRDILDWVKKSYEESEFGISLDELQKMEGKELREELLLTVDSKVDGHTWIEDSMHQEIVQEVMEDETLYKELGIKREVK